jgi:hypothetical protein
MFLPGSQDVDEKEEEFQPRKDKLDDLIGD